MLYQLKSTTLAPLVGLAGLAEHLLSNTISFWKGMEKHELIPIKVAENAVELGILDPKYYVPLNKDGTVA